MAFVNSVCFRLPITLLVAFSWGVLLQAQDTTQRSANTGDTANTLTLTMPATRIVYQRNTQNLAIVPVQGNASKSVTRLEARLIARSAGQGTTTRWIQIPLTSDGHFSGSLSGAGGWYNLEVRAFQHKKLVQTTEVERVGIGEVFVVVGHSVAQGGAINIEGASDDRVSTVEVHEQSEMNQKYLATGDPQYLPEPLFVHASDSVAPAPFAHNTYFWSRFADLVVAKENVPVLIYNAAFGGTSVEHWAKASQGIQFEHGFCKSKIRMPYINLYNTFKKYIVLTGMRALSQTTARTTGRKKMQIRSMPTT